VSGCSDEKVVAPNPSDSPNDAAIAVDPEAIAMELVSRAGWEVDAEAGLPGGMTVSGGTGLVLTSERQVIVDDIVHYSFLVSVGPGPYDVIGLHRVVREKKPGTPIKTKENVFLQHGDAVGFVKFIFGFAAPSVPDEHAVAVFLAQNDVDVWGIDQSWALIPSGVSDFSFMADWGLNRVIPDLQTGLGVARACRARTGSGYGKMILLGYSSGAIFGYSYMDMETQLPPGLRHVGAYIPVDAPFKFADESNRQMACADVEFMEGMLGAGMYQFDIPFATIGILAQTDPYGVSPILPDYTNLQTALLFGASTYLFYVYPPLWHYFAGVYDEAGVPTGLQYTPVPWMLDFLTTASPYEATRFIYDYSVLWCEEEDSPYDDHVSEITVPLLYVGAYGGMGEWGNYSTTLVGSSDVSILMVSLHPAEEIALDFGHIDLFTAENAPSLVWQPMYNWIKAHTEHGQGKGDITME
jgi:hypothetical protein